jgi:hypothetical protein
MKKALAALLLCAGCSSPSKPGAAGGDDREFEKFVVTQLPLDPALLRTGQKVLYAVRQQGSSTVEYFQWSAVGEDAQGIWIENKVPHPPTDMVKKYKMERGGKLLEYWAGPPGGSPAQLYPRPGAPEPPTPRRDPSSAVPQTKEELESVVAGGKAYACSKITTVLSYADGRKSTMVNWMSKDVPFGAEKLHGGLVRRQFGRVTMELVDHSDKGARPELALPK